MFDTETINSIISTFSSINNNDDGKLMWRMVETIEKCANVIFVGIYLVDSSEEWAVIKAGTGIGGIRLVEIGHKENIQSEKQLHRTVAKAIYFNRSFLYDYSASSLFFDPPVLPSTVWELSFPLTMNDDVIGALEVNGGAKISFQIEDTFEFQRVADEVSKLLVKFNLL